MKTRTTSVYHATWTGDDASLGAAIARLNVPLEGSGGRGGERYISIRTATGQEALDIFEAALPGTPYVAHNGLGIHRRVIERTPENAR